MKRWRFLIPAAVLLLLMLRSGAARDAAVQGVEVATRVVFPSLFPFCVLTRQLPRLGRGGRSAFLMGLCGGYPLGMYTLCRQASAGELSREEAERLIPLCNHTGPAIFFGMVGALLFSDPMVCAALYGIHLLSALLLAAMFGLGAGEGSPAPAKSESITQSIQRGAVSTGLLCAYVVFFSVLLSLLLPPILVVFRFLPIPEDVLTAILSAIADLPSGIRAVAALGSPALAFLLCSAGISWGGLCVHWQAKSLWQEAGLQPRGYFAAKALQAAFSLALAFPAAGIIFHAPLPIWPGVLPFLTVGIKKSVDFFRHVGYDGKKNAKGRRYHAVS